MPSIDIRRQHHLTPEEARHVVDSLAARMREKFDMKSQWDDNTLHFERPGIQGTIVVEQAQIRVDAKLGMMFAPLKGMIEQEIRRKLDEHFA